MWPSTDLSEREPSIAWLGMSTTFQNDARSLAQSSHRPNRLRPHWRDGTTRADNRRVADAAYALGLSDQLPARVVFLTDGPSRTVAIGLMTIQLRRTTAKNTAATGRLSGLLIQALRAIDSEHITPERREHLKLAATRRAPGTYKRYRSGPGMGASDLS